MKRLVLPLALVLAACGEDPPEVTPPPTPDTTAPAISELAVAPETVGRGEKVTATFKVDEPLRALLVRIGGRVAECAEESLAYTCVHTISGAEKEGAQTVEVLAIDLAGNEATASGAFTIDYAAPSLAFTAQPPLLTNDPDAKVEFTSDDPAATFTCTVDGGEEAECTSPFVAQGLSEGLHIVRVTAKDAHGNTRSIQASFTVDVTPPSTTLIDGIPALTREQSHVVTFTTNDPRATFECRIDAAAYEPCTSPFTVTGYSQGDRSFEIRARDEAGNVDASPVKIEFTADWTAPVTTVGTVADTGARDIEIPFTSNEPEATVECSVYGGAFEPCTSPITLTGLADGSHAVLLRGRDEAGNVEDPPVFVQFVVDRTPPNTSIFANPANPTNQTQPSFEFSSTEANSTFECSIDGGSFEPCTSPASYPLTDGEHTFAVKATDKYGNPDETAATYTFVVDTVAPVVTFNPPIPAVHLQKTLTVEFAADETATYECSLDGAAFAPCTSPTVLTDLTATVDTGTPHVFVVRATDPAGNVGPELTGTFDVDLSTPAPGIPKLVPLSPSYTSNTTPTFAWEAASDATAYDFELSDSPEVSVTGEFVTPKQRVEDVTTLSQVSQPLTNGVYYFHVRAKNVTGPGGWSLMARFEVNTLAQVSPVPAAVTYKDVICRNASECVVVGAGGQVVRTTDNGRTLERSSVPTTSQLESIAWAGGDVLVAIGGSGIVLRSHDFGASWFQIPTTAAGAAFASLSSGKIHFNGETGIIVGASGNVYVSTDAGATWSATTKPGSTTLYGGAVIETTPSLILLVAEGSKLHRSTDGGATWTPTTIASSGLPDVAVAPDGTVFVGGGNNIYRSTDKGETFTQILAASGHRISGINGIWPLNANTLMTANSHTGTAPVVAQTRLGTIAADNTISFVNATRTDPDGTNLGTNGGYSVWVDENLSGMMVGVNGMFYTVSGSPAAVDLTTPRGTSSAFLDTLSTGTIQAIAFPSTTTGYATVMTHANFLKTVNSGNTWKRIDIDPTRTNEYFSSIDFLDEENGFGVGLAGGAPWAARTSDGGLTWTQVDIDTTAFSTSKSLSAVAFAGPDTGFIAGPADSATSDVFVLAWNPETGKFDTKMPVLDSVGFPLKGVDLVDLAISSPTTGYVIGRGFIAKLDAAAGVWKSEGFTENSLILNAVGIADEQTAVVVGSSGNIWRRTVDGSGTPTWTKLAVTGLGTPSLYDVSFLGQTGYIVGASGNVLVSRDAGATWSRFVPISKQFNSVFVGGPDRIFLGSSSNEIFRSEVPLQ